MSSQKAYLDQQQVQQQGKKDLAIAKAAFTTSSAKLKTAVKGNYGRKINEALDKCQ